MHDLGLNIHTTIDKGLVYQYEPVTWVENLAVRPNGWILPITTTSPLLNQLNPNVGELHLVHDFSKYGNAMQGITVVMPDVFAVDVLTCNITALSCTQGSVSTWLVSFNQQPTPYGSKSDTASVRQVASFPKAGFLNGIAALNSKTVLLADSFLGGIWALDISTGKKSLIFTDASMKGTTDIATGINGSRVRPGVLYFTNSAKGTLNRIPINDKTGSKTGKAEVIASGLAEPDDLEIDDAKRVAFVCNGAVDQILRIPLALDTGKQHDFASIPGPTSVRWSGEMMDRLYVSDVGGLAQYISHNYTTGGAIYSIDL